MNDEALKMQLRMQYFMFLSLFNLIVGMTNESGVIAIVGVVVSLVFLTMSYYAYTETQKLFSVKGS